MTMILAERLEALVGLGKYIQQDTPERQRVLRQSHHHNGWFTPENSLLALERLATAFLQREALEHWVANYPALQEEQPKKRVGMVLAGNIPAVGFHDVLCCFVAGHEALMKLSDKDKFLMTYLLEGLIAQDERAAAYLTPTPVLKDFEGVIATGSNNSALYFKQYFEKYPHIIRQNRNAVGVLTGKETAADFLELGKDIFTYFGLGCRSVSKLYVPKNYDFIPLLKTLDQYKDIHQHNKYRNNYDYNRSIYYINNVPHLLNDCLMVLENESLLSRISSLHYEQYENQENLQKELAARAEEIQCVVSQTPIGNLTVVPFGESQLPRLDDYADGVDTMTFLTTL
ncbi:MAG: acyl-CoA reductase [Aureispira sp.]